MTTAANHRYHEDPRPPKYSEPQAGRVYLDRRAKMLRIAEPVDTSRLNLVLAIILVAIMAVVIGSLSGCQKATKDIQKSASRVGELASSSEQRANDIKAANNAIKEVCATQPSPECDAATESIEVNATAIASEQQEIQQHAGHIQSRIPDVSDNESLLDKFVGMMKVWGYVVLICAAIAAAIYFGVGPLIRRGFNAIGMFIPKTKKSEAKLLLEAADEDSPTTVQEAIALKRGTDPQFDAAVRAVKRGVV